MIPCNRIFQRYCLLSACAVCVLVGGRGELKAQPGPPPKAKPGAYHAEGRMMAFRFEPFGLAGAISPTERLFLAGGSLLGLSLGAKIPVPERKSQIIPTAGVNFVIVGVGSMRLDLSTEWRYFPFGHAKEKEYDWKKPWFGVGANASYNLTVDVGNPFHAGAFLKMGLGYVAFFAELGLLPLYNRKYRRNPCYEGLCYGDYKGEAGDVVVEPSPQPLVPGDPNARAFRFGLALEF